MSQTDVINRITCLEIAARCNNIYHGDIVKRAAEMYAFASLGEQPVLPEPKIRHSKRRKKA